MYQIGKNSIILPGVKIGNNVKIQENIIIGYNTLTGNFHKKLIKKLKLTYIGDNCLIRPGAVIYGGVNISKNCWINHHAVIRENVIIDCNTSIGTNSIIGSEVKIGNNTTIHNNCEVGEKSLIESFVFLGPNSSLTNNSPIDHMRDIPKNINPVKLRWGCAIGAGVTICPGIEIGKEAIVGAGSTVTRNVPPRIIVAGNPAVKINDVSEKLFIKKQ